MRGFPKNGNGLHLRPDIMSLFDKSDIVCVQESLYAYQDYIFDITYIPNTEVVSTTDYNDGLVILQVALPYSGGNGWII